MSDCSFVGLFVLVFALLMVPREAAAQRKGFVLELGAGVGSVSARAEGSPRSPSETAVATNFKIGFAPSDQLLIRYSNGAAFFRSGVPQELQPFVPDEVVLDVSGLSGIGVTYYLRPTAPSFYVGGTIGIASAFTLWEDGDFDQTMGRGLWLNAGFEFARHFQIDADVMLGNFRDNDGFESSRWSSRTLRVTLNWLHY